ncbi:membrane fusion protein, cobalt-zinc-cadmium efflux system [Enhydrobacter aerosaccus]|uniref:Membrane fusion protein, cobalt-zinc-cadmium efflux system n=1 Tax=Enhydrobacter aerosaccus TaxID=225324 RepID=A0A1T4T2W0_9HYPH|nr:efflux RND transporter periplasmic adaptor subunit [Enhydrobacter aerosaccus]SKA34854.1 membrane fusion protein, cobalt-zinc-cadmium efflux system [Enhydrobacter aerosaccus]
MLRSKKIFYACVLAAIAAAGAIVHFTPPVTASSDTAATAAAAGADHAAALTLDADAARRAGLKVERIEPTEVGEMLEAFGTVGPNRNRFARVSAPVAGRLTTIAVDLGATVAAGALLAQLESPDLAEARTAHQQNKTELDLAQVNYERAQKLAVDASIAQKDVLRARADYERARAALAASDARLATLGVTAAVPAGTSPALLAVTAPLAGTVVERTAVLGEYAQAYQPLFAVADLSTVWVEASLYERDLAGVAVGAAATVRLGAYPGRRFDGTVTYIGNILDKETRTAMARIEVANPDGLLKPGLFANVEIARPGRRAVLRVPEEAVLLLQGQMTVFVAEGEGFVPRPVEIASRGGGWIVVRSGLEAGDRVVVDGAYALKARLLKSLLGDSN